MSARCLNQTSWSSSLRPLRRNLDPCNLMTLPQRSGELFVTLCTALLWIPLGRSLSSKSHYWFEARSLEMTPVFEAKRALAEYKRIPNERNYRFSGLPGARLSRLLGATQTNYWTELSENIQSAAITGNIRGMYDCIKKALGPSLNKIAPLRSSTGEVITDRGHQLERWVEHYSRENTVSPSALDAVECLPTMEELDREPVLEELSKAIDNLASGKAPGSDWIPPPSSPLPRL